MKYFLIVRQQNNQLGDLLCSVPMYKAIKKKYPDSNITLITAPTNYEIPYREINPYIDNKITFRKSLKNYAEFIKELRKTEYDFGIVPSTLKISRTSNIINFLSKAKVRVGVKSIDKDYNYLHFLLDIKSDYKWNKDRVHQIYRILDVVKQIGCNLSEEEISGFGFELTESELNEAKKFLIQNIPGNKLIFGFHPGAGKTDNQWSTDNFIQLIEILKKKFDNDVLITSGYIDEEIISKMMNALKSKNIHPVVLEKFPVRKLAAILKNIDLYITNDTGVMHVAGFAGTRIISLFGPTKGYEWAPFKSNQIYIQSRTNNIDDIIVDEVYKKVTDIYEKQS